MSNGLFGQGEQKVKRQRATDSIWDALVTLCGHPEAKSERSIGEQQMRVLMIHILRRDGVPNV